MQITNEKCLFGNKVYYNGQQACDGEKCYVCESGEWTDRSIDLLFGVGP